jgi:hypothetical protein
MAVPQTRVPSNIALEPPRAVGRGTMLAVDAFAQVNPALYGSE